MSDIKQAREALERIQCNYVHVFKARENGKTQLVHDLNTIKKALDEAEKNEQTMLIFKDALTVEHHNLQMIDNSGPSKDCVDYFFKTLYSIKQNELHKDLRKTLREWVLKNAFPKELKVLGNIEENLKYGYVFIGYDKEGKPLFQFTDTKLYEEIKKNMTY